MTVNSLYPSYVEINYHSSYAPHTMTIPTNQWVAGGPAGEFELWAGGTTPAETAIQDFVDLMLPFFPTTVVFDHAFVYNYDSPTSEPRLVAGTSLTGSGTAAGAGWNKATQATWSFRSSLGGVLKYVMLDINTLNSFAPVNTFALSGDALAFVNYVIVGGDWLRARDNGQPSFFTKITYDLNDALRKQYHLD